MTLNKIKKIIIESCAEARRRGRDLVSGAFGTQNSDHCCALTAVELAEDLEINFGVNAADLFGWGEEERWAFVAGFDKWKLSESSEGRQYPKIFKLGEKIREIVKPNITIKWI